MQVMTFNLRFENDRDGSNVWMNRREVVARLIRQCAPAILGTQEGRMSQLAYLQENLPDYCLASPQRPYDETCQYPTLFFRRNAFSVLETGEFWLSETPEVHRSKSWDSAFPRMISFARVSPAGSDRVYLVAVTHLDHLSVSARQNQSKMIAGWVGKSREPVILMGDFNDSPASVTHAILTSTETGLLDTWQALGHAEDVCSYTHHGFTGIPQKTRMDWILADPYFIVKDAEVIRKNIEHRYPSDHFPYRVELEPTRGLSDHQE